MGLTYEMAHWISDSVSGFDVGFEYDYPDQRICS